MPMASVSAVGPVQRLALAHQRTPCRQHMQIRCSADRPGKDVLRKGAELSLIAFGAAALALTASPAVAEIRLPPIDRDPARCDRAYVGNTIGQANAVSDKLLDLRNCNYEGKDLSGKVLSGALLSGSNLTGAQLIETVLTKAYVVGADLTGANLTNAVVDRVDFRDTTLKNAKFKNAVITGVTFEGANMEGAVFEDALIGNEDAKRMCKNPTLTGNSRMDVGCRN